MVTERFRKELKDLSPWQLTMAVKDWMTYHDARINFTFDWATPSEQEEIPEEYKDEEMLILMSTLRDPKPPKPKKVKYVKL